MQRSGGPAFDHVYVHRFVRELPPLAHPNEAGQLAAPLSSSVAMPVQSPHVRSPPGTLDTSQL